MRSDHGLAAATGGAGSLLVAVGGPLGRPGLACAYAGLTLLVAGWWWYGRAGPVAARHRWVTLALWTCPLLVVPPLFSRDVYSYLAQGLMAGAGLDVHRFGPAALGGPVAARVPEIWQDTPSPYGPVSLLASRAVTALTGDEVVAGVLGMRLVAVAGLVLLAAVVPALARAHGVDEAAAWWLVVLNPLTVVHLVGGAHNDALMAGLLAAGLAAAIRGRPVLGAVLVTLAALVKAPAALGLAAVVLIWAGRATVRPGPARAGSVTGWARAGTWLGTAAVAGVTTVAVSAVTGFGYGWIRALRTPVSPGNWALTSLLGRWTAELVTRDDALALEVWRWAGMLAVLVVAGLVWAYRERLGPLPALGLVLLAVVVFGPALRPWYLLWALVPLAVAMPAAHRRLALLSVALTPVVLPDGYAADRAELRLALLGIVLGVAAFALAVTRVPARKVPR